MHNIGFEETYKSLENVLPEGFRALKNKDNDEIVIAKDGKEIASFDALQASTVTVIITTVKTECLEKVFSQNDEHLDFLGDLKEMIEKLQNGES